MYNPLPEETLLKIEEAIQHGAKPELALVAAGYEAGLFTDPLRVPVGWQKRFKQAEAQSQVDLLRSLYEAGRYDPRWWQATKSLLEMRWPEEYKKADIQHDRLNVYVGVQMTTRGQIVGGERVETIESVPVAETLQQRAAKRLISTSTRRRNGVRKRWGAK